MSSSQSSETGRTGADEDLGDLFEEAPVAYVHEDMNTRFIRANRAAREILGISAEEVSGTLGTSLVVDTPEAKRNVREALEHIRTDGHTEHRVIELRRKDNGERIWVQWWSKPAPSGGYTRSVFIDSNRIIILRRSSVRPPASPRSWPKSRGWHRRMRLS